MKTECPRADQGGLIAFVHIPKTAGTTLNAILAHQYSPGEIYEIMMRGMSWIVPGSTMISRPLISFSKIRRLKSALRYQRDLRVIRGHFDLSVRKLLPASARFFTLLRDPVERAISHYYHYRRRADDPIHPLAMKSTLMQWVSACGLVEMDNGQTRRLAGEMNLPCGQLTLEMLDRAKSNLVRNFAVVGLTERFEESLILLQRAFHWPLHRFPPLNVGERPPRGEVDEEVRQAIEDRNLFDLNLYRFASVLFERAASRIDMASELARLRAAPEVSVPSEEIAGSIDAAGRDSVAAGASGASTSVPRATAWPSSLRSPDSSRTQLTDRRR
jgi:hypothetical protein